MRIEQNCWSAAEGWSPEAPGELADAQLVFVFGSTEVLRERELLASLRAAYPVAQLAGCSTAGEICGTRVLDDSLVATAVYLERSTVRVAQVKVGSAEESRQAGGRLACALPHDGLVHAIVFSEGLTINGSDLVRGLAEHLPADVPVTGGLSGDGARFAETLVLANGGEPDPQTLAILGLYGEGLEVGYGSLGGWDPFGPERLVTRSQGNVLYELDGRCALDLYKLYLGEHARDLPASGLHFPLKVRTRDGDGPVVRTILSVDEDDQSMTFAGDIPQGAYARFMKANFDRLIDGAMGAARESHPSLAGSSPALALLISCVGRKLVLQQRVEEEVEGVRDVLGEETVLTGFYSYGELSPLTASARCELHNQTMTITTLTERRDG